LTVFLFRYIDLTDKFTMINDFYGCATIYFCTTYFEHALLNILNVLWWFQQFYTSMCFIFFCLNILYYAYCSFFFFLYMYKFVSSSFYFFKINKDVI
jgi:hypothetical protein